VVAEPEDRTPAADGNPRLEVRGQLSTDEVSVVRRLVASATEADGVRPLSEHVVLHLRYGGDTPGRNLLLYAPDGRLGGYAHLDVTDVVAGSSAELVVDPAQRGRGLARALVAGLLRETPDGRLRLWAHGEHPGAAALARAMGFEQIRALWQMRRSLYAKLPPVVLPDGVTVRTFQPARDERDWLDVNARAFADHPEQGGWTLEDLHRRMQEPWFDPAGFFLAERAGRLVGFHWTKVHGGEQASDGGHGHDPIGEVYVVGVDPAAQGGGLGKALVLTGLRHLRALGLPEVMLYVEADNTAAIRLYTSLGFTHWDTDVMFRRS